MCLTPMCRDGGGERVFPVEVYQSALIESAYSSSGAVAAECTMALGFKPAVVDTGFVLSDPTAHYLLTIRKVADAITVWKQGGEIASLSYAVVGGATYAELLANVLTAVCGDSRGYYSRLVVVEYALDYSAFWECSDAVTGLWVPGPFRQAENIAPDPNFSQDGTAGGWQFFGPTPSPVIAGGVLDYAGAAAGSLTRVASSAFTGEGKRFLFKVVVDKLTTGELKCHIWPNGSDGTSAENVSPTVTGPGVYSFVLESDADSTHGVLTNDTVTDAVVSEFSVFDLSTGFAFGGGGCRLDFGDGLDLGVNRAGLPENRCKYSSDMTPASWVTSGATVTTNQAVGPGGLADAELITEDTGTGLHSIGQSNIDMPLFEEGVYSVVAKRAAGVRNLKIVVFDAEATGSYIEASFDLETAQPLSMAGGGNGVVTGATVEALSGGWLRCAVEGRPNTAGRKAWMQFRTLDDAGEVYAGDGASGLYLWGAQVRRCTSDAAYVASVATPVISDWTLSGTPSGDTPTNNGCTWNPLYPGCTTSNGNLAISAGRSVTTFELSGGIWAFRIPTVTTGGELGLMLSDGTFPVMESGQHVVTLAAGVSYEFFVDMNAGVFSYKADGGVLTQVGTASGLGPVVVYCDAVCVAQFSGFVPSEARYKSMAAIHGDAPEIGASSGVASVVVRTGDGGPASSITLPGMDGGPDLVWNKARDAATGHVMTDTVRGVGNELSSNSSQAQRTGISDGVLSFDPEGYTLGSGANVNAAGVGFLDICLKAGVAQGFEIVSYTGTGGPQTIAHSLGRAPTFMVVKGLGNAANWAVYHRALGPTRALALTADAAVTASSFWADTAPSATHVTLGGANEVNANGYEYIAYLFTDSDVFRAFSYHGNASSDGPFVNLGGRPLAIPFWKNADAVFDWGTQDGVRNPSNPVDRYLGANTSSAESTYMTATLTSSGFKVIDPEVFGNGAGDLVIGLAMLESIKYSNAF